MAFFLGLGIFYNKFYNNNNNRKQLFLYGKIGNSDSELKGLDPFKDFVIYDLKLFGSISLQSY